MPWHIETSNPGCASGYAVVKDSNGEVEGCHRTRREALAQLAALNIAESRRAESDKAIIVDIDGTLLDGETIINSIADYVRDAYRTKFIAIVTARLERRKDETISALKDANIPYDILRMRPDDSISGPRWKGQEAARIMQTNDVELAIDNDEAALNAYKSAGVPRVLNPNNIRNNGSDNEIRQEAYTPNDAMVAEARRGLEWRRTFNRGGTDIGVARARDIVNRSNLSRDTVARMVSYFARHEVDKQGEGFSRGEPGYPSAGRIAWALWGGDAGKTWAEGIIRELED
jgi:hypothetical protein